MTNFKKIFFSSIKTLNLKFRILLQSRSGQSLGEVLVGLTIGAILIGAASFLVVNTLRSNASLEKSQKGIQVAQELLDKIRSWGSADWFNVYDLSKGSSDKYFLNASSSELLVINGEESVLSDDVTYGLVGHWKMDEATSTVAYDSSGNSANGTLTSSPIRATSTCKIAGCLVFSNNYVSVSAAPSISSAGTLSAWTSVSSWGTGYDSVIFKGPGVSWASIDYGIFRNSSASQFLGTINDGTNNMSGSGPKSSTITLGQWYHLVFTWNGTVSKFYTNGIETGSYNWTYSAGARSQNMALGKEVGGSVYPLNGSIDDVRIYNRALSADEIKQIYQSSVYTRSFSVENVCRSTGATGEITGSGDSCAGGSANDPSTQQVTVSVGWVTGATSTQLSLTDYLTRWKNAIFEQADWSGGLDTSGSYTNSSDAYSSTTNTNIGTGVILELP